MTQEEEDVLLAKGMILIKEGILQNNLKSIENGYNLITDEGISFPTVESKTKLERLKETLKQAETPSEDGIKEEIAGVDKPIKAKKSSSKKSKLDNEENVSIIITEQKGGTKFARDGIQIISSEPDEDEIKSNKLAAKKTTNTQIKQRTSPPRDNSNDENREVGYIDRPAMKPPWS